MPTTVVSSGELPTTSRTISDMIEQNLNYMGLTSAGTQYFGKSFSIKEAAIIAGTILLIVFFVKKVK